MDKHTKGDKGSTSGAKRAKAAVVENLAKQGVEKSKAEVFESKLLEVAPLAYGLYASDINAAKRNDAPYVIVAPKDGLDAGRYSEGIQIAENLHKEINSMARNGIDVEQLKLLNEKAKEVRDGDKFAVEALNKFSEQQPSKQAEKQASKFQGALVDQGAEVSTTAGPPNKKKTSSAEQIR